MDLKLSLLIVAMAASCVLCGDMKETKLFEDKEISREIDGPDVTRQLEEASSNQEVYDILMAAPEFERIHGEFTVSHFQDLAKSRPDLCQEYVMELRRRSCENIPITSLEKYCNFCLSKQTEYCKKVGPRDMLDYLWGFTNEAEEIQKNLKEVADLSKRIDEFIGSNGGKSGDEEKMVVDFCKDASRAGICVEYCSKFVQDLVAELSEFAKDSEETVKFLEEKSDLSLAKPLARCNIVLAKCR